MRNSASGRVSRRLSWPREPGRPGSLLPTTDRRDEMYLAVLAYQFGEAIEGRFAVDSNCHIRTQVTVLEEAVLDARKALLQVVDNGAYRPPHDTHLRHTTGEGLQHRGDEDDRHAI